MKNTAHFIARSLEASGILSALESLDRSNGLRVLAYHRVDEPDAKPDLDPALISATPDEFRVQMLLIAKRYQAVSLGAVLAAQRGEAQLPRRAVLITFDDGYMDFASNAWPVLCELGLPAVLFVPTAFPDQTDGSGFWWDRLYAGLRRVNAESIRIPELGVFPMKGKGDVRRALNACKRHIKSLPHKDGMKKVDAILDDLPNIPALAHVLSWSALRKMSRQGLMICPHSHQHALCTRLSRRELKLDLATSQVRIVSELGVHCCTSVTAWPANACSPEVCEVARDLGFEMGFGGLRGIARIPIDEALDTMRVPVLRYQPALFRAQLRPSIAGLGRWVVDRPANLTVNLQG